jgi:hypothetical protein
MLLFPWADEPHTKECQAIPGEKQVTQPSTKQKQTHKHQPSYDDEVKNQQHMLDTTTTITIYTASDHKGGCTDDTQHRQFVISS